MSWWRDAVLYQIYPRSFADTNGDGIGDLPGVTSKLDHIAWMGFDGIWLNPITASPNADWGYDVSDFCAVDPALGTLDDLDELVAAARERELSVVLDIVPNHTSVEHPWFVESRSSRDNPKRDWYVWADPAPDGGPPNNWRSEFSGGGAWILDEPTRQYFLAHFLPEQADLDWWSPQVREEFERILRFWFDRGVAGFRIDVAHMVVKDAELRDNPAATEDDNWLDQLRGQVHLHDANQPGVHELYRQWRELADSYDPQRLLLGETFLPTVEEVVTYYGNDDELHLAFDIPFTLAPFDVDMIRGVVEDTEAHTPSGSTPCYTLGNHDLGRFATRWCGNDDAKIRLALTMFFGLRGSLVLYYGDELGLPDTPIPKDRVLDPVHRDPERTPMPWVDEPGAGFTAADVEPWLPFGDLSVNVAAQRDDAASVLHLTRDLIALRGEVDDLRTGAYETIVAEGGLWAFSRGTSVVVGLNFGDEPVTVDGISGTICVSGDRSRDGEHVDGTLELAPRSGAVVVAS